MLTVLRRLALAMLLLVPGVASAASLLPNGEQMFIDANGAPLAGGFVYFYVPGTSTPKDTWRDSGQSILNSNPITLDAAGRAIIYGAGTYRQVVQDANGNTIWDQLTADSGAGSTSWGGTSGGTANAQTITAPNFSNSAGQSISFIAGFSNTSALTLNVNSTGPISVVKDTATGPVSLTGGEVVAGNIIQVIYDSTDGSFHLVSFQPNSFASITAGNATFTGSFALAGVITPTHLSGDTNDWAPDGLANATVIRAFSSVPVNLTGLTGGVQGRLITIQNVGAQNITLPVEDAGSQAANRFDFPQPVVLRPTQAVTLLYDGTPTILNWRLATPAVSSPIAGGFTNLKIVNGASLPNTTMTITASALTVEDANSEAARLENVNCTINASTTGAGGLDTGSLANATWYALFVIYNPTTSAKSCLASLSATAPTLPTGYAMFHRFGWALTDGSAHFYQIVQYGRDVQYVVGSNPSAPRLMDSGVAGSISTPTYSPVDTTTFVPPTASAIRVGARRGSTSGATIIAAPNNAYGAYNSTVASPPIDFGDGLATNMTSGVNVFILESSHIYWASSDAGNKLYCYGWIDNL